MNDIQLKNLEMQGMIEHIKKTELERDLLAASNARWMAAYVKLTNSEQFVDADSGAVSYSATTELMREFDHIAESTPQQSLAEIQARSVESELSRLSRIMGNEFGDHTGLFVSNYLEYRLRNIGKQECD